MFIKLKIVIETKWMVLEAIEVEIKKVLRNSTTIKLFCSVSIISMEYANNALLT